MAWGELSLIEKVSKCKNIFLPRRLNHAQTASICQRSNDIRTLSY